MANALLATWGTNPLSVRPIFQSFVSDRESVTSARVETLRRPLVVRGMTNAQRGWLENLMISPDDALVTDFERLKELDLPALIVWGREAAVTPLWQGEALQKLLPHASLTVIEGAGHIPYLERTSVFDEALLAFVLL